jgi:ribose transport system ATP-binding protein
MDDYKQGISSKGTNKDEIILKVEGVTKYYPGIIALDNVDFLVKKGEIHAVVGENGAGKSTLCNVITGVQRPNIGKIFWKNKKIYFSQPKDAIDVGIRMVYQERNLIPFLTGAQNICLGNEKCKGFLVDEEKTYSKACETRERLGINVVLNEKVSSLSSSSRQMIEILRAFIVQPELLILDEPTSSLSEGDIEVLFKVIKNIKSQGISVIFISHKLNEVFALSDRISIFRNGKKINTAKTSTLNREQCIKYMINRDLKRQYPEVVNHTIKEKMLEVKNLQSFPEIKNVSIHAYKGEVLGFYGLVGSGRTELAEAIYGLRKKDKGEIIYNKKQLHEKYSPEESIKDGLLLIPEDRKEHAIFRSFDIKKNISIPVIKSKFSEFLGLINMKRETIYAEHIANLPFLRLKYRNLRQSLDDLSGGNKQKVIIGRWLEIDNTKLVIMDEPTQGIDVETKYEIYILIRILSKNGITVIFISSELPELLGVCDRLYVFRFGYITKELQREEFSEEKVLKYALA